VGAVVGIRMRCDGARSTDDGTNSALLYCLHECVYMNVDFKYSRWLTGAIAATASRIYKTAINDELQFSALNSLHLPTPVSKDKVFVLTMCPI